MSATEMVHIVKDFIHKELAQGYDEALLGVDESLIDSGILDSLGIMSLLTFIETEFKVSIPPDQIDPDNFETIRAVSELITTFKNQ